MARYIKHTIYLSSFQKRKIKERLKARQKCQVRANHSRKNKRIPVKFLLNKSE